MALQLRLGLLSDWGAGITFDHRSRSGDAGALLTSPLGLMEQIFTLWSRSGSGSGGELDLSRPEQGVGLRPRFVSDEG